MTKTIKPSTTEDAHPKVIVSFPIKPGQPGLYATRGLLDMCCTGVVAKKSFAEELIRSGTYHLTPEEPTTWTTSKGKFTTTHEIKVKQAMLPSLSTKRSQETIALTTPSSAKSNIRYVTVASMQV